MGQWDSFDYLKQIVTHQFSDLGIGRPVFIGYNIILWELVSKVFRLPALEVESVVVMEIVVLGGAGVLLFDRLARRILPVRAARLATVGLLLSPVYALYSGYVMTEVPMLVTAIAAAAVLWGAEPGPRVGREVLAGLLFGISVGIREQAVTLAAAFLWILWVRRFDFSSWVRSSLRFGVASVLVIVAPVALFYLYDPSRFMQRTRVWLSILPTGEVHFWENVQASLIYTFAICPAAWLALLSAGTWYLWRRLRPAGRPLAAGGGPSPAGEAGQIPSPLLGFTCCLFIPLAILWRDADVQIHPRYLLVVLPASLILCAWLYHRWTGTTRAAVRWAVLQLVVFGIAQAGMQPLRQLQAEKRDYAKMVRFLVPGEALLIAGGYSPILDYYRGLRDRPGWRILWSGWIWDREKAAAEIAQSWARNEPVYLCDGPAAWLYFEDQRLDLYYILRGSRSEQVAPGLTRVEPR
jgi:hypothetical protein